ncbi:PREDICTED: NAC domain-containing protein 86-like [Camelina sativa]|uniref:NAC domain-containing protein 86-like n=1 Tax=Camelina sativa TaxID=90675 RepID=A0ABM1QFR0_CAMSA|nr:PREDICTED: NAC domain-containing protein 86-like [Camelina sativa]
MSMPGRNKRKERSLPEAESEPSGNPSSSADHSLSSPPPTRRFSFPPGFNFRPNDLDVFLLLCRKRDYLGGNRDFLVDLPIHLVNIYESNPGELTVKFKKGNDTEWFFISKKNKMGKGGKKQKRYDKGGYWHATVGSNEIDGGQGLVGNKTALRYYVGKQPNGVKTSWLMHEYWVDQCPPSASARYLCDYSLCKIYRSTQAINKQKKAEDEENEQQQPPTVDYHQPQPHHDILRINNNIMISAAAEE